MNDAELYQKSNALQKRDAVQILEQCAVGMTWKNTGDRIIDIGSGDGSVTKEILERYLPSNFEKLVGCDISEKMIYYANQHHRDERTSFRVLDIEGDLPQDMKGGFDHAFSFYTLHWIRRQNVAFTNIYDLLADGGSCLLLFIGHMPVFDVYRILARSNKWSFWLKEVDRFVSPYHDSQCPEKEIRNMMEEIGFKDVKVTSQEKWFVYNSVEALKKAVQAVNPFNIPEDIYDDFFQDYFAIVKDMRMLDVINNNVKDSVNIKFSYGLLTVYGAK